MSIQEFHPAFFTATINDWIHLLKYDKYKNIIVDSIRFLVNNKRVKVFGFVIMPNHIHIIWQAINNHKPSDIQRDFLKFTSQKIKFDLQDNFPDLLEKFKSDNQDRKYQIWKYNSLSIELYSEKVFEQKLDYIHNNPVQEKWKLANQITDYYYSSAKFYYEHDNEFNFLSHYKE